MIVRMEYIAQRKHAIAFNPILWLHITNMALHRIQTNCTQFIAASRGQPALHLKEFHSKMRYPPLEKGDIYSDKVIFDMIAKHTVEY